MHGYDMVTFQIWLEIRATTKGGDLRNFIQHCSPAGQTDAFFETLNFYALQMEKLLPVAAQEI